MWTLEATSLARFLPADSMNLQLLVVGSTLAGALLLGAVVIALISRWRRRSGEDSLSPDAQLAQFRSLYESGTISQEEFERLRTLLNAQRRETWGVGQPARPARVDPPREQAPPSPDTSSGDGPPA
jgi:hypothetical protein